MTHTGARSLTPSGSVPLLVSSLFSYLCLLALIAMPTSSASANQSTQPASTELEALSDTELERRAGVPIEEIIVTSQQSFRSLRLQIEVAEEQLYSIYNDLTKSRNSTSNAGSLTGQGLTFGSTCAGHSFSLR